MDAAIGGFWDAFAFLIGDTKKEEESDAYNKGHEKGLAAGEEKAEEDISNLSD